MNKFLVKYLLLLAFVLFSNSLLQSQNLINNPGFEDGMNQWWGFGSTDGTGSGTIVSSPVHSGTKALKIEYPGTQNWDFSQGSRIPVSPGEVYDLSCWVKVETYTAGDINNPEGIASFLVTLYDSDYKTLYYVYSPCIFEAKKGDYKLYSSRFLIPPKVKYLQPDFSGQRLCSFYVDDVSLIQVSIESLSGDYSIENDSLKVVVSIPSLSIALTNKKRLKTYTTIPSPLITVNSVEQLNPRSLILHGKLLHANAPDFKVALSLNNRALQIRLIGDGAIALSSDITFPGSIISKSDEYLIIPKATGEILPINNQNAWFDFKTFAAKSTMPFVGVTNLTDGYMVSTDDQWDAGFSIDIPPGQDYCTFHLMNKRSRGTLGYERTIYLNLVDSGYVEMCKWYRQHAESLGYVKTFKQKAVENPNIDKLMGAVDFWAITWDITSEFLDSLKLEGLDKAIWNFNHGWNATGFSKLIDSINSKGFLSGRYDQYCAVYDPPLTGWRSEGFPNDVIVKYDGQLFKCYPEYDRGQTIQGYFTCSTTHLNYCMNHLQDDLSQIHYNSRFIDGELGYNLSECYSDVHPATRKQDAGGRINLLGYIKNDNHLVTGSEEAHDFAFKNVDYGEGTLTIESLPNSEHSWYDPVYSAPQSYIDNNIKPTVRVPLHGLTYHDVHIPTWWTGDGPSRVPDYWDEKNLWNILYGTMPLYMPPSRKYWNDNFENFIDGYHLISTITRNVGYEKMTFHQFITLDHNVQKTTFGNGWNVTVNFGASTYDWEGKTLAPKGFYASDGKGNEVYKLSEQGNIIDWAFANDRIFFNPHGTEIAKNGVRTTGSVFIKNYGEYLLISFIGNQNYVDLNASQLPYNISNIYKAYDWFTGTPVTLTDAGGGWKKLQKTNNKLFYKVTLGTSDFVDNSEFQNLRLFPNPIKDILNITSSKMIKEVQISNLLGLKIYTSANTGEELLLNLSQFRQGIYLCKIIFGNGDSVTRKIIIK
jgi:hypothetical protein